MVVAWLRCACCVTVVCLLCGCGVAVEPESETLPSAVDPASCTWPPAGGEPPRRGLRDVCHRRAACYRQAGRYPPCRCLPPLKRSLDQLWWRATGRGPVCCGQPRHRRHHHPTPLHCRRGTAGRQHTKWRLKNRVCSCSAKGAFYLDIFNMMLARSLHVTVPGGRHSVQRDYCEARSMRFTWVRTRCRVTRHLP